MGFLILGHLFLNWKWIINMTKKNFRRADKKKLVTRLAVIFMVIAFLLISLQTPAVQRILFGPTNSIIIDGVGEFEYDPKQVATVKPDIFQEGKFSIFDILVHLNDNGKIDMEYHFDESTNTHVIDGINGKDNWWYMAYYDGGWPEDNVFRMDHYPHKANMYIRLIREDKDKIENIYRIFRDEVQRVQQNNKIIIPRVVIRGTSNELVFQDVEVEPHNLRNDMLQNGTITAIDVIMTLGDMGLITYDLQWYTTIGTAEVKNYFIDGINEDKSQGRCGFVYEEGSYDYTGFRGNHIHIPSDIRVINSPEYMEWFWICI
jgi:hypothetical protein